MSILDPTGDLSNRVSSATSENCICLSNEAIEPYGTNKITAKITLNDGDALYWNMLLLKDMGITIWFYSPWAKNNGTFPGFVFWRLSPKTHNKKVENGVFGFKWSDGILTDHDDKPIINFIQHNVKPQKTLQLAWQWQYSKLNLNIANVMIKNSTTTPTSNFKALCFTTEDINKKPRCTECTDENIISGCLGLDIAEDPLEIIPIAGAIVGGLFVLRATGII